MEFNATFIFVLATVVALNIPCMSTRLMHKLGQWAGRLTRHAGMWFAYAAGLLTLAFYVCMFYIDWRATLLGVAISFAMSLIPPFSRKLKAGSLAASGGVLEGACLVGEEA